MTTKKTFREKYIATPEFYKMLIAILVPLVIRQGITNFVSLLDNVMVGSLGAIPMSAVSIDNQLMFIVNLTIFGAMSGASIFGTQYAGLGDWKKMREVFRVKIYTVFIVFGISAFILLYWCEPLVMLFLKSEENSAADIASTLSYAKDYMKIAVIGLFPFAAVQAYGITLSEVSETKTPMKAGIVAIFVNLTLNYVLIYGKLGFPALGVRGAAIATVIARFVELGYLMISSHRRSDTFKFLKGAYSSFYVPGKLVRNIIVTGSPLMINEILWSTAQTFITKCYSVRGIDVISSVNITMTAWNLFCVIMFAFGTATSIIIGQKLGAGDREGAIDSVSKIMFATLVSQACIALLIIATSGLVPQLYDVSDSIKKTATQLLIVAGCTLPIHAIIHNMYFVIRSGGKTLVTFLFDSVFQWTIPCSIAYVLSTFTDANVVIIFGAVMASEIIKLSFGIPMLKSGFWAKTLVGNEAENKNQ